MPETSSLSLYQIDGTVAELVSMREEVEARKEGAKTAAERAAIDEERAAIDGQIEEWVARELHKVSACYGYIRHQEQQAEMAKQVAKDARQWQCIHENRAQRVRDMVKRVMESSGLRRVEGAVGSFTVRTSGSVRPLLPVDETLLPDEYKRVQLSMPLEQWQKLQMMIGDKTLVESLDSIRIVVDAVELRAALEAGKDVPGARLGDSGTSLMVR